MKYSSSIVSLFAFATASMSILQSSLLVAAKKDKDNNNDNGQDLREAMTVMAIDDIINLPPGTSEAFIAVLENDSGMNLAIKSIASQASQGECIISLSLIEVVYTPPDAAFIGSDQCEYEACDAMDMCDTATLTVVIKEELTSGPPPSMGGSVKTLAPTPSFPEVTQAPTPGEIITPFPTPDIPEVTPAPTPDNVVTTPFPTEKDTPAPVTTPVYPTPDYYKPTDAPVDVPYNKPEPAVPAYYPNPEPASYPEPVYQVPVYEPKPNYYEPESEEQHHDDDHYDATTDDHYAHHDDHYEPEPHDDHYEPVPTDDGYVSDNHHEHHDDEFYYPGESDHSSSGGSWSGSGSDSEGESWSGSGSKSGKGGKSSKGSKSSSDGVVSRQLLRKNRILFTTTVDDYYTASYGYTTGHIIDQFDDESHHHSKSGKGSGKSRKLLRTPRRD